MRRSTAPSCLSSNPSSNLPELLLSSAPPALSSFEDTFVIREEEELLFKIFIKKLPAALAIFDVHMRYIIASDTYMRDARMPIMEITGKRLYDIVPDIPKKWRDRHQKGLQGEHLSCEADQFKRADGSVEWWRWELLPWYKPNKEIGGIILFVEEITKRKAMEKKMKEMIKTLNRSNEDLERFAHICAHDLNEPLRTIGSYCHLLQKDFSDILSSEAKNHFKNITKSVHQMSDLINGILSYSQLGTQSLNKTMCSTQDMVNSVKVFLEERIREKKAILKYKALPTVYADKVLLSRVFQNLISNALKFNESHPPLIQITATEKKKWWVFTVEDNGIGIEEAHYKTIFGLFKRLYPRSQYEGTGLGLSFCKKIIEAHGGDISVKSDLNKKTCFSFTLPKKIV